MNLDAYTAEEMLLMQDAAFLSTMVTMILIIGAIAIVCAILMIAAVWRILKKSGNAGWKALIPIYNNYMLYKISWKKKFFWLSLLMAVIGGVCNACIPYLPQYGFYLALGYDVFILISMIFDIVMTVKLAKAFRKGGGFAVGMILLPVIFYPILGFGKAKFRRRKRRRKIAPAAEEV